MAVHGPLRAYSRLIYNYPLFIIVISLLVTLVLPLISLYFFPVKLSNNAEIGFDTKDTDYSGPRMSWQQLQLILRHTNRIPYANPRYPNATVPQATVTQATVSPATQPSPIDTVSTRRKVETLPIRERRSWGDNLLSALQTVTCYEAPIPLMNHLSQLVIQLPSYESIYSLPLLEKLCKMQGNISKELASFEKYTPYRNIWNVANYFACLSPNFLVNCDELNQKELDAVHVLVEYCLPYRSTLVDCKVACEEACTECKGVPANCSSQMMFDLFYRVLPMDLTARPFYLNTFLPFFTLTGYNTQNMFIPLELYDHAEAAIVNYTTTQELNLKGISMDVKRDRLLNAAIGDSFLALLAAFLVLSFVALHSRSIFYAFAVFCILVLAVLGSLAFYALFTPEFPLLNLVIFVLLIAVGTDDAFLLFSAFPEKLDEQSFHKCLAHTGATMFLTSFSTAIPFFVNIFSNVIVFRCFGLFAGMTTIVNYLLVVSFLPAFLVLQRRHCFCLPSIPHIGNSITFSIKEIFPLVIVQGRFIWLSSLSIIVIGASWVAFHDIRLPEYNPLQLFVESNPHEWYDNHAEKLYEFVAAKIALPLFARLVWGQLPIQSTAKFRADAYTPLMSDPAFNLTKARDIRKLANSLTDYRSRDFINHTEAFWPERFLLWSHQYPCASGFLCCNISSPLFQDSYLDFCLRNSTQYLFTSYNDTPLFDNNTYQLTGYTALLPTKLKYSHRFARLSHSFDLISSLAPEGGWWAPEWPLMSTWFDLQNSIISDCRSSAGVSIAAVAVFAIVQLKLQAIPAILCCTSIIVVSVGAVVLYGWVIGVLEAVILVLVVGLSFDYTLHYGAAIPKNGCRVHRIQKSAAVAAVPVSLSAITSFTAGASMLFAKTHAFFQVGVFLVVSTVVSWLFATFFFLPLLTLTLREQRDCLQCAKEYNIPMKRKF